ncbi:MULTISPECIES: hypothetical protein [Kitasatospora]|uniref:hypothetical protein n=1 Tax=Kitasatospora TaxID=2063 RepID=UPI000CB4F420|nr:hypothetical protein [Kitasatospora sp. GP30]MDH6138123.1 hypothetical protein [Kitasatospora sp. GP30]
MLRRTAVALLSAAALAVTAPAATAAAPAPKAAATATTDTFLGSGQQLLPGQSLTNGESALVMQGDGNLVMYLLGPTGNHGPAIWSSGTWGHSGAYAYMQPDGNLVVYLQGRTDSSAALWSTNSWGHRGAKAQLLNGWFCVFSNGFLWQTNTGLLPAMGGAPDAGSIIDGHAGIGPGRWIESKSVWLLNQSDGNLVLYRKRDGAALWSSGTQGQPGAWLFILNNTGVLYLFNPDNGRTNWTTPDFHSPNDYAKVQDDGNFVVYRAGGGPTTGGALWSTGTWGNW